MEAAGGGGEIKQEKCTHPPAYIRAIVQVGSLFGTNSETTEQFGRGSPRSLLGGTNTLMHIKITVANRSSDVAVFVWKASKVKYAMKHEISIPVAVSNEKQQIQLKTVLLDERGLSPWTLGTRRRKVVDSFEVNRSIHRSTSIVSPGTAPMDVLAFQTAATTRNLFAASDPRSLGCEDGDGRKISGRKGGTNLSQEGHVVVKCKNPVQGVMATMIPRASALEWMILIAPMTHSLHFRLNWDLKPSELAQYGSDAAHARRHQCDRYVLDRRLNVVPPARRICVI
ncbi:hypothetical protein EVAR_56286_1 [Eumeta japonica]|uniref:Uncharacterized protein n=1 Tax=Eumeta variegata TaxID=151549 RepID=A0A4C1YKX5_EUMVA|nr:hypothetical protein EVAR_56286_1 [Eumeta japonica]